jgi:hypothetical protein
MNILFYIIVHLVIDQRNCQCSEVCLIYLRVSLDYTLVCAEYRIVNNLAIILEDILVQDLDKFPYSFIRLEGRSPRVENSDILYILSS